MWDPHVRLEYIFLFFLVTFLPIRSSGRGLAESWSSVRAPASTSARAGEDRPRCCPSAMAASATRRRSTPPLPSTPLGGTEPAEATPAGCRRDRTLAGRAAPATRVPTQPRAPALPAAATAGHAGTVRRPKLADVAAGRARRRHRVHHALAPAASGFAHPWSAAPRPRPAGWLPQWQVPTPRTSPRRRQRPVAPALRAKRSRTSPEHAAGRAWPRPARARAAATGE